MERSSRATTRVAPTMPRGKRLSRPVHCRGDPRGRPAGGWESPLNRIRQQSLTRRGGGAISRIRGCTPTPRDAINRVPTPLHVTPFTLQKNDAYPLQGGCTNFVSVGELERIHHLLMLSLC